MYTIGKVSEIFGLPVSTLRYYDKEGLLPGLKRESGIRKFGDKDLETLRVIECLKKSGLEIKEIKRFIKWCAEGSSTFRQRKELFEERKKRVEEEIGKLNEVLNILKFKCWYYGQAEKTGKTPDAGGLPETALPDGLKDAYRAYRG
ncbi:MAG: MerR family transcriptional regulator [Candidatus Borkfalkiaceae bacterium]|nr:MerR family transcriptional regulator [Christensenellaceae bacterium]